MGVLSGGDELRETDRRTVDLAHSQATEHDLVEVRVGSAGEKAVKLVQQLDVRVVAVRRLTVATVDVVLVQIDLGRCQSQHHDILSHICGSGG